MNRYLLDTNVVSHLIKGNQAVARRVVAVPMASLCISAITCGELHFGLAKRPEAHKLHAAVAEFLKRVDVLPWTSAIAATYGLMRAQLEQAGRPLGSLDMLIAAHALHAGFVLVTNDQAFSRVVGLKTDDWTQSSADC